LKVLTCVSNRHRRAIGLSLDKSQIRFCLPPSFSHRFLGLLILWPWSWRWHFPPKHQLTCNWLHSVVSQRVLPDCVSSHPTIWKSFIHVMCDNERLKHCVKKEQGSSGYAHHQSTSSHQMHEIDYHWITWSERLCPEAEGSIEVYSVGPLLRMASFKMVLHIKTYI
jgi:hypothetical protein